MTFDAFYVVSGSVGTLNTHIVTADSGTITTFTTTNPITGGADLTLADIKPDGIASAGATNKLADAGHVHAENSLQSLLVAPTGALVENIPRRLANTSGSAASASLYMTAIGLPANQPVNGVGMNVATTVAGLVSDGWYCIADSNRIVRATSADQTNTTIWGTASTIVRLNFVPGYTAPSAGLYYIGVQVSGTPPAFSAASNASSGLPSAAPTIFGTAPTAANPPAVGSTIGSLGGAASFNYYAFTI